MNAHVTDGAAGIRGRVWYGEAERPTPIDVADPGDTCCPDYWVTKDHSVLYCTRVPHTDGPHQACGLAQTVIAEWPVDEPCSETLPDLPDVTPRDMESLRGYHINMGAIYEAARNLLARYTIDTGNPTQATPDWHDLSYELQNAWASMVDVPELMRAAEHIGAHHEEGL